MIRHDLLALERVDALAGLPAKALSPLASGSRVQRYGTGTVVLRQGELVTCLYLIRRGRVRVQRTHRHITEPFILRDCGAGETVGSLGLFDGAPSPFGASALEETEALELDAALIARVLLRYPSAAGPPLRVLSSTIRTAVDLAVAYP